MIKVKYILTILFLMTLSVLREAQEPEQTQIKQQLEHLESKTSPSHPFIKTQWDIIRDILVKPGNPNVEFILAPYVGHRSYHNQLSSSMDLGFTMLYPLENDWYLLGGYSYAESFDKKSLKSVHNFDYGFYTTPFTLPKYNLSVYTSIYFSRDSYTDSSHLMLGYGIRYQFKKEINTVTFAENSIGWGLKTKVGIERNVIIPKKTFESNPFRKFERLKNINWKFWKKKKQEEPNIQDA